MNQLYSIEQTVIICRITIIRKYRLYSLLHIHAAEKDRSSDIYYDARAEWKPIGVEILSRTTPILP